MLKSAASWSILILFGLAGSVRADGTKFWTSQSRSDFMSGKSEGVSILAEDALVLAPEVKMLCDTGEPFIWCMITDGKGTLYAATGHDGHVLRIGAKGDTSIVYDALEPEATALALKEDGSLYVGTSPEGRVYRLKGGAGEAGNFFDPEEKYIWSMLPAPDGGLYVSVGSPGKVYKVNDKGEGRLVLDSQEQHIISLALDREGNLLAGSSGSALLYQVDKSGTVSILYDSPLKDLRAILVDKENNLFAGAFELQSPGDQAKQMMVQQGGQSPAQNQAGEDSSSGEESPRQGRQDFILRPRPGGRGPSANSEIYFFDRDRFVTRIWRETGEAVMSLGLNSDDRALFVSRKEDNNLFAIDRLGEVALLNSFQEIEVTGFLRDSGRTLICTGNPGKIYEIGTHYRHSGTFTAKVLNAGIPSAWGRLEWEGETPANTRVFFQTRSGNTDYPDTTWSPWSQALRGLPEDKISSPARKNLQWKATLESDDVSITPSLAKITVSYLSRNRPPMISPIRLMPQGLYIRKPPLPPDDSDKGQKYPYEVAELMNNKKPGATDNPFQGKKEYQRNLRMVGWNANDANGDELLYNIHYRGIAEKTWRLLALGIDENSYILDTENMADGKYVLKVTAYDSLDNAGERAMFTERISPEFVVDNTPPAVRGLRLDKLNGGKGFEVTFETQDETSNIDRVEYALDSGDWMPIDPEDRITDSREEKYRISLPGISAGEHTVSVQVYDDVFNTVIVRRSVTLP